MKEENNMTLDILLGYPIEVYKSIFNFNSMQDILSLVNTCTALRSMLIFHALEHIIEHDHNYALTCDDSGLIAKAKEINEGLDRFSREIPFVISPSEMTSENGGFYTIDLAVCVPKAVGGCYIEIWKVNRLLAYIGFDGVSTMFKGEVQGSSTYLTFCNDYRKEKVVDGKTLRHTNPIMDYLHDTPCYQSTKRITRPRSDTEETIREMTANNVMSGM